MCALQLLQNANITALQLVFVARHGFRERSMTHTRIQEALIYYVPFNIQYILNTITLNETHPQTIVF